MRRATVALLTVFATAWSCRFDNAADEPRELEVYGADASDSLPLAELGHKQRDLLRALTDPHGDPTPLMSGGFALIDHADTAAANRRAPDGRRVPGADFIETLATRLPVQYAEVSTMEGFVSRPSLAVMYVRHSSGERSITYWTEAAGTWRATILLINVDENAFSRAQRSRIAG